MSAVTLPASIEALTTPAVGPVPATADVGAGFPELLSSLAAGLAGSSSEARADRDARTMVPAAPHDAVIEISPLAPETPVVAQDAPARPDTAEVDSGPKDPPQPKLVAAIAATASAAPTAVLQPPDVEVLSIPLPTRPFGASRIGRQRGGEDEAVEARPAHLAEPAPLTIQQALAAVAAIAPACSIAPTQAQTSSASQAPLGSAAPEPRLPAFAMVGSGTAKPPVAAPILSLEGRAGGEGPTPRGNAPLSLGAGLPLDPGFLTASLGHPSSAPIAPHGLATPIDPQASNSNPELHQLDALMRDIAEVSGTSGRASFRLTADQLGPIDVRLHTSDAGVAVTIRTHDDQSHTTVSQAQQQLTDDMRANGLKVAATNVMLGGGTDRQRQDRPHAAPAFPIEVAAPETEQSKSLNTARPDGRYA